MEECAFGMAEVVTVEDEDAAFLAVRGPEVLCVGHTPNEEQEALAFVLRSVIDEDEVENETMGFVVFEGAEHFFGETGALETVDLHEDDGMVAADAEAPEAALGEGVFGEYCVAFVAEGGRLCHVFGDAVVEAHLTAFEQ